MKYYLCTIKNDDVVVKTGYLHASNSEVLLKRIRKEILPNIERYNALDYSQAFCEKCNSDKDVINFFVGNRELVLCQHCRLMLFKTQKKGAV